jgi:hypothetical protein
MLFSEPCSPIFWIYGRTSLSGAAEITYQQIKCVRLNNEIGCRNVTAICVHLCSTLYKLHFVDLHVHEVGHLSGSRSEIILEVDNSDNCRSFLGGYLPVARFCLHWKLNWRQRRPYRHTYSNWDLNPKPTLRCLGSGALRPNEFVMTACCKTRAATTSASRGTRPDRLAVKLYRLRKNLKSCHCGAGSSPKLNKTFTVWPLRHDHIR